MTEYAPIGANSYYIRNHKRLIQIIDKNGNLINIGDATINGTLTADRVIANTIERGLESPATTEDLQRQNDAYDIKVRAAYGQYQVPLPAHPTNGDEDLLTPLYIGNYTKGMNHNANGEVVSEDYEKLLYAVETGRHDDYDAIPTGDANCKYHSPQAGNAFDLEGADFHALTIPIPPSLSSAWGAAEIVENYWMAIMRDVSFADYGTNANTDVRAGFTGGVTANALADLNALSDYRGPTDGGVVTAGTLFRGKFGGNIGGLYVSQFMYLSCPFGASEIDQKMHVPTANIDFMTDYSEWLNIQNGKAPVDALAFNPAKRYIINGRDLSQWVHMDVLYGAYFQALLILLGISAPLNIGNPYKTSTNQTGFATFGPPHVQALLAEVASRALKAAWYQKWNVHRKLRPEEFGGRIHTNKSALTDYPLHAEAEASDGVARVHAANGTWLLPMAFPEGAPFHTSYPAGHATVSGACVTILKAWFDGSYVLPNGVTNGPNILKKPSTDGLSLNNYVVGVDGPALTVQGELNKLSANIGIGRNHAGVHYRADYDESAILGEKVAIEILRDQRNVYGENFNGFTFTKFDGTTVTI